jgi:NADH dehydrogenase FAD-containing subunit
VSVARRVVVLGGGFGGVQAAIALERLLPREDEILLVSEQNFLLFTPLLPQIASSRINPRHIVQTIRDIRGKRRFAFRRDTVASIDVGARRVNLASGDGASEAIAYDALVIALGSRSGYFGIDGARENTWDFKTLEDAVVLRDHVLDMCEHADHTADEAARRELLRFVVAGGGYTGVELVTELSDFFSQYVLHKYRGIRPGDVQLIVLEASPEILRGISERLKAHSLGRLNARGIEVRTSAKVTRCGEDFVEINGNEIIRSATIMWTAGVRANPLVEALPGPHDRVGRALVNSALQLEGYPEVFVTGDSAAPSPASGAPPPQVAPVAIAEGGVAARNVAHFFRGESLQPYTYKNMGMLVSLGMDYAVVSIGRLQFSGYFAWLFWNAVHLYKLVGLKKQVQVAIDWMLGTVFPRDASILRAPMRCRICEGTAGTRASQKTRSAGQP